MADYDMTCVVFNKGESIMADHDMTCVVFNKGESEVSWLTMIGPV